MAFTFRHPYEPDPAFSARVAYFCMEYAIHQPLKTYCGGLGYLAGSHLRSAFALRQNMVAIGILWKYGYYDQVRKGDRTMDVLFAEKNYGFLEKTDLRFPIQVAGHDVAVTAWYLPPEVYNTVPLFLLSTDLPENDYLARTISHRLYDPNPETKIAASILLGLGGAKLLEELGWEPQVYHLNESHALPLGFYLYDKYKDIGAVREKLVFTNHTPEDGGNPRSDIRLLEKMGFFSGIPITETAAIAHLSNNTLDHTSTALRLAGLANGVSKLHRQTLARMWGKEEGLCPVISITNGQNFHYWSDAEMYRQLGANDDEGLRRRKGKCKEELFEVVADEEGEIFRKDVLTIVFAKRFSGYKRADLLLRDMDRFTRMVTSKDRPVQVIWAGKPFPMDYTAIGIFDKVVDVCKAYRNCAILAGYELRLSGILKRGADVWLNVPRYLHEASGTSGMTAAMNGAINVSIADGWIPEFARDKVNSFLIPA